MLYYQVLNASLIYVYLEDILTILEIIVENKLWESDIDVCCHKRCSGTLQCNTIDNYDTTFINF